MTKLKSKIRNLLKISSLFKSIRYKMSRQYAPHIVLARNPAPFRSRVKVTTKADLPKVVIPKVELPKTTPHEPYYDPVWPETDDFGTTSAAAQSPRKVNTSEENKILGDKIVAIIAKEVAMCRGFHFKTPVTHIRLSPAPLSSYELVSYVVETASSASSVKVVWTGSSTITIVF